MQPLWEAVFPQGATASQTASCHFLFAPLRDKPLLAAGKAFEVPCFAAAHLNHVSRPQSDCSQTQPSQLEHKPHREPDEKFLATIKVSNSCLSSSLPHGEKQPGQSDGWLGTTGLMTRSVHRSCLAAVTALESEQARNGAKALPFAGHISELWCFFQATLSDKIRHLQMDLYTQEGKPLIYLWASWIDLLASRTITYLRTNYSWKCIFDFDWKMC